jgi:hypothetical protein
MEHSQMLRHVDSHGDGCYHAHSALGYQPAAPEAVLIVITR